MQPTTAMAGGTDTARFGDPKFRDDVAALLRAMYLAHEITPEVYAARCEDLAVIAARRTVGRA
jgi:hypothetical protein